MNIDPREVWEKGYVDKAEKQQVQQNGIDLRVNKTITLQHGETVNVDFMETIHCKDNVFAMPVCTRSSYSRKGIFCTSGVWDTGYSGPGGCTVYNMSGEETTVEKGTPICQIIFFKAPDNTVHYNGFYNKTESIKSKI